MAKRKQRKQRRRRSSIALRWLGLGALVLVGLLYVQPLDAYLARRASVAERKADVQVLRDEQRALERRLRYARSNDALQREARRLGYVRPGERLFIVKGIPEWRARRTIRAGG